MALRRHEQIEHVWRFGGRACQRLESALRTGEVLPGGWRVREAKVDANEPGPIMVTFALEREVNESVPMIYDAIEILGFDPSVAEPRT